MTRFTAFGLRFNPFGAPFPGERGGLAVPLVDLDALAAWLREPRRAVEFVGAPGRGKTSQLCGLNQRFAGVPVLKVDAGQVVERLPEAAPLFVDEVQRVPPAVRREAFARGASVALAAPKSLQRELERAGLAVKSVRVAGLSLEQLGRYVTRRLDWARHGAGVLPEPPRSLLEACLRAHGGDVRAIEAELYEWVERRLAQRSP